MEHKMHIHDEVMHNLICDSLRSADHQRMDSDSLTTFNYLLGVALHNLPHILRTTGKIPVNICLELNEIDPTAKKGEWGEWVNHALHRLGQDLPYPQK